VRAHDLDAETPNRAAKKSSIDLALAHPQETCHLGAFAKSSGFFEGDKPRSPEHDILGGIKMRCRQSPSIFASHHPD
jgi:hypothetical protein